MKEAMHHMENIVAGHLDAWNAPAGPDRTQLIASLYAPDVFVGEPQEAMRGHDGMEQAIARLQAQLPRTRITRSGPIQVAQDMVTYRWSLGAEDGPAVAAGRDVLIVGGGKVTRLYVVIDAS
ncbi:nuclear transport factor 2 family protein [Nocardioides sp. Soil805]|uniref:nuclear transport factor 2 family protein n=1 Tax=Nocardioides sp. Soil805 TaxID=1736416 RepID=UPI00138F8D1A|nr:nuclear transport factor 2 family protein [Nocardioides sp. Soil805]